MLKKLSIIIILCLPVFILTGCWDAIDINKRSIITAVGIGKDEEDIEFNIEIASLFKSSTIEDEEQKSDMLLLFTKGKTFNEARHKLNQQMTFPGFLGATRVVLFDKNYALEDGIEPYLNRINKVYDYRKTLLIALCDDSKTLLNTKPENEISAGFSIESIIRQLYNRGYIPYISVSNIISNIAFGNIGFVIPYLGLKDGKTSILGMGIFNNKAKLIDIIDFKESRGLFYFLSDKTHLCMDVLHKEKKDSRDNIMQFRVILTKRKILTEYKEEEVIINIDLDFNAYLLYQYYNLKISTEDTKIYENQIEEKIKNEIFKLIEKSQDEYKCDIFEFAKYFKAQNINEFRRLDWNYEYPKAKINVKANVKYLQNNNLDYELDYYKE